MLEPHVSEALRKSDWRIIISGATGWLGRATLDLLQQSLSSDFSSRVLCFGSRARTIPLPGGNVIEQQPLSALASIPLHPTFFLHFAFLTKDRAEHMDETDYREANERIRRTVLDALDPVGCEGLFVASSGAAHVADDENAPAAMRLYGQLKRDDEREFASWAEDRARTAVIARIHNLSGPHINKTTSYALACFILDGLAGRPIAVRASHEVWRGYVAVRELMSLVVAMLLEGLPGAVCFDTGGEAIELGALARAVAAQLENPPIVRPADTSGTPDRYLGDAVTYRSLLDRHRISAVGIEQQISETIDFLRKSAALEEREGWLAEPGHGSAGVARDSVPGGSAPTKSTAAQAFRKGRPSVGRVI